MKKLRFNCHGATIDFRTNSEGVYDTILNDEREIPDTIPGIEISPYAGALGKNHITYLDQENESVSIDPMRNQAALHFPKKKLFMPDLSYLALSMFAKELNAEDKYFIHSAIVAKDDRATLLVGDGGSGKTTLALHMCMDKGFKLLSNDRAVIGLKNGKPYVFDGTLQTDIRVGMVPEFFPGLMDKVDESHLQDPWKNKLFINPEFENLGIETAEGADIANIVFTSTYPVGKDATTFSKVKDDYATLLTMQSVSDYIRATKNIVLSTNHPFPSFDNDELAQKRMRYVERLRANTGVYNARGNIRELANQIDQELYH